MTDLSSQPNATTRVVEDLVDEVLQGRLRIPHFQRGLRWQWEDVRRLFDSILKGYPIGSLLFWERQAAPERVVMGALTIDAPAGPAFYIVDGQQRLTSLANALTDEGQHDSRFALAFNLKTDDLSKPDTADDSHLVPLPVLFDLQRLLAWFSARSEVNNPLFFSRATRVAKAIRQFTIPAYVVKQQDEAVLRDIFDRMNNYGRRLSRAEVFSALHSVTKLEATPSLKLADIADVVDAETGFGRLDDDTVLRAVLARRGPDVTREIRNEFTSNVSREFGDETIESAYREGGKALALAIKFLQETANVPHFGFLPYRYVLVVLTRYFAHFGSPSARNTVLLRRWFWRAVLVGPSIARGSWTGAMGILATKIRAGEESESAQRLLEAVGSAATSTPRLEQFRTNQADTRVILNAMWSLGPRSPVTTQRYDRAELATILRDRTSAVDAVHTFFRRPPNAQRGWSANRTIALDDTPDTGMLERPLDVSDATWAEVLDSHAIDATTAVAMLAGGAEEFLTRRQARLVVVLNNFLQSATELQFEDTPPLDELSFDEEGGDVEDVA